jgi:hypothetical protein
MVSLQVKVYTDQRSDLVNSMLSHSLCFIIWFQKTEAARFEIVSFNRYVVWGWVLGCSVMLKRYAGEEGEKVDMQRVFGFMGLFILVGSWWLGVNSSLPTVQFSTSRM